jgi:hypothetical protein
VVADLGDDLGRLVADLIPQQITAGIERLTKRLDELHRFDPAAVTEQYNIPEMDRLSASIDDALVRTFGVDTVEYDRYRHLSPASAS